MHKETEFIERLKGRGLDDNSIQSSLRIISRLQTALVSGGFSLARPDLSTVETWISDMLAEGEPAAELLLSLARYFSVSGESALAIRLLAYLSPIGVFPAMSNRLASLEGSSMRDRIMSRIAVPPEGSPPEAYPEAAAQFASVLKEELGESGARRVLAWNVHGIPPKPSRKKGSASSNWDRSTNGFWTTIAARWRCSEGTRRTELSGSNRRLLRLSWTSSKTGRKSSAESGSAISST